MYITTKPYTCKVCHDSRFKIYEIETPEGIERIFICQVCNAVYHEVYVGGLHDMRLEQLIHIKT